MHYKELLPDALPTDQQRYVVSESLVSKENQLTYNVYIIDGSGDAILESTQYFDIIEVYEHKLMRSKYPVNYRVLRKFIDFYDNKLYVVE